MRRMSIVPMAGLRSVARFRPLLCRDGMNPFGATGRMCLKERQPALKLSALPPHKAHPLALSAACVRRSDDVDWKGSKSRAGGQMARDPSIWLGWAMQRPLTGVGDENRPWSAPPSSSRPPGRCPWGHVEERRGRTPWIQHESFEILNLR